MAFSASAVFEKLAVAFPFTAPRSFSNHDSAQHPTRSIALGSVGSIGYRAGDGGIEPALVFVHGIGLAACSMEHEQLMKSFSERRRFAMDWPGFGASDRDDRPYAPELYSRALARFVHALAAPSRTPVDLVAAGLGAEFAVRMALAYPDSIRSLTLLAPTGLGSSSSRPRWVARLLERSPRISELCYRVLTCKLALFLALLWSARRSVQPSLLRHAWQSARQPGARFAPMAWLRGELTTSEAYEFLYRRLRVPTLVVHDGAREREGETLTRLTRENPFVRAVSIENSGRLPHLSRPMDVALATRAFHDAIELAARADTPLDLSAPLPQFELADAADDDDELTQVFAPPARRAPLQEAVQRSP